MTAICKTYYQLSEVTKYSVSRLPKNLFSHNDINCFSTICGLILTGNTNLDILPTFTSNRYFLQSIFVETLPSQDNLLSWLGSKLLNSKVSHYLETLERKTHCSPAFLEHHNSQFHYSDDNCHSKTKDPIILDTFKKISDIIDSFLTDISKGEESLRLVPPTKSPYTAQHKDNLATNGYTIIEDVIPKDKCDHLLELTKTIAKHERDTSQAFLYGPNNSLQRIYNILSKHEIFSELITTPVVLEVMDDLFDRPTMHDRYYLSSWHANLIPPGGEAQKLHLDAAVPEPLPPWIIRANVNFILDDYAFDNGATLCVPGSHKFQRIPRSDDELQFKLSPMEAKRGAVAIWHGHLWHKSGYNQTTHERVALLGCFSASFLREMSAEEDYVRAVPLEKRRFFSRQLRGLIAEEHGIKKGQNAF